jgi:serine/threonine protein kinase
LINGLKVIHSKSVIHRDINPTNILKTKEGIYKIIDLTSFKYFLDEEITITGIGTNRFIAPELASTRAKIGRFSDIYSLGITLYSVLDNSNKRAELSPLQLTTQLINDIPNYIERLFENEDRLYEGINNLNISNEFKNII